MPSKVGLAQSGLLSLLDVTPDQMQLAPILNKVLDIQKFMDDFSGSQSIVARVARNAPGNKVNAVFEYVMLRRALMQAERDIRDLRKDKSPEAKERIKEIQQEMRGMKNDISFYE